MSLARIGYRARQLWLVLRTQPASQDLETVAQILSPSLMGLFLRLQPSEQAHSIAVLCKLESQGEVDPGLQVAALLHDIGKVRFPLRLWERIWIVLGKSFFSSQVKRWGTPPLPEGQAPTGWRRAFLIAEGHPEWGARMAAKAGASPLAVSLIRRHQDRVTIQDPSLEDQLLRKLQSVDDES